MFYLNEILYWPILLSANYKNNNFIDIISHAKFYKSYIKYVFCG